MVGWYHTHPGWGVFLSGMDLFICNNFFNRPLDVALVIDPCAGDRGWFQWSTDETGKTERTGGFYLVTNRHRSTELNYFSEFFAGQYPRIPDPRFNRPGFIEHANATSPLEENMVNVNDDRRGVFEFAILSMLFLQLLVVGLIGWRLTKSDNETAEKKVDDRITEVEQQIADTEYRVRSSVREQAFSEVLNAMASQNGGGDLANRFSEVAEKNIQLKEDLKSQLSRIRLEELKSAQSTKELNLRSKEVVSLKKELESSAAALEKSKADLKTMETETGMTLKDAESRVPSWFWYTLGGAALLAFGGFAGFFLNRIFVEEDQVKQPRDDEQDDPSQPQAKVENFSVTDTKSALSSNIK